MDAFVYSTILNTLITMFAYLFVPMLILLTRKRFQKKTLRRFICISCFCVWLLFRIIQIENGNESSSGAAVFLWGSIGYWILRKYCLKQAENEDECTEQPAGRTKHDHVCLSTHQEESHVSKSGNVYGQDIMFQREAEQYRRILMTSHTETDRAAEKVEEIKCNSNHLLISNAGKKKHIPFWVAGLVVMLIFCCIMFVQYESLHRDIEELEMEKGDLAEIISNLQSNTSPIENQIRKLEHQISDLQSEKYILIQQLDEHREKVDFYDEYVVFTKNGELTVSGRKIYHRYECEEFRNDYFFWRDDGKFEVYHIDDARALGYASCGKCIK